MSKSVVPTEDSENFVSPANTERQFVATLSRAENEPPIIQFPMREERSGRRSLGLERRLVEFLYRRIGSPSVQFVLWDGAIIGERNQPVGTVRFCNPRGLRRVLLNRELGFCEGYVANDLDVEGDFVSILTELNRSISGQVENGWQSKFTQWPWTRTSFSESKDNVHHHYDIGNDFYRLWLDPQLVYSCAYYRNRETTLGDAQTSKLDYVCRKLRLKPGERVVEAGCGWGALALHMARHYGVTVRAFNLSHEQVEYARRRAKLEQLHRRIEFIEDDYRNITGKYDAFASVGMLEHVGVNNYRSFGRLISRILTSDGRGLIHSIGRNVAKQLDPWTLKYIFPGAYVPCLREMMELFEPNRFSVLDVENLRPHYARTCADWLNRFEDAADSVQRMFDERFVRMWRLYLSASTAAFLNGDLQLFQVVFARTNNNDLPWTRQDWYA